MVPIKMFTRALMAGNPATPLYVVFFVTERCTARCGHCLLGHWESADNELTLDEIERWARRMSEFYFFLPTGGEPFLREDLPDIVRLFVKHCGVLNVGIPTNGSLTEQSITAVERILAENPRIAFAVDVSIDGIGEDHDRIRGVPGLFERTVATYRALDQIASRQNNFNLNVALTVSALNQDRLQEILDYLLGELRIRNINHLLVRGRPRDVSTLEVALEKYRKLNRKMESLIYDGVLGGYSGYDVADGINALKIVRQRTIEKIVSSQSAQLVCQAGRLGAVVRADGGVFACELRDERIGNLRDADFDFNSLWFSRQAQCLRDTIRKEKCFCTYECFLTPSLLYNPASAADIFKTWVTLKTKRGVRMPRTDA